MSSILKTWLARVVHGTFMLDTTLCYSCLMGLSHEQSEIFTWIKMTKALMGMGVAMCRSYVGNENE